MPEPQYEKGQASEFSDFRRMSYLANTGITIYLENNGRLEHAQQMAGHESPLTTKLYDLRPAKDEITLSDVRKYKRV